MTTSGRVPSGSSSASMVLACAVLLVLSSGCRKSGGLPGRLDDEARAPGGGAAGPGTEGLRRRILTAQADAILAEVRAFDEAAAALEQAASRYADTGEPDDQALAREAWRDAMDTWQRLEVMQVGPLSMSSQPGGEGRRGDIYMWPLFSRCLAEQILAAKRYEGGALADQHPNVRELGTIEYLLFYEGQDNACAAGSPLNSSGDWGALGVDELAQRKAAYAAEAAALVRAQAAELRDAWDPANGDFHGELAAAGESETYPTTQSGLNALSDALFYLDTDAKDMKLGAPLGLLESEGCAAPPCVDRTESPFSEHSKDNIRNNLRGFQSIFDGAAGADGGRGLGFSDLLVDVGQGELASEMNARLSDSLSALASLGDASLEEALTDDTSQVEAMHGAIREVTTRLKTEFVTRLDLELPVGAEGDND